MSKNIFESKFIDESKIFFETKLDPTNIDPQNIDQTNILKREFSIL